MVGWAVDFSCDIHMNEALALVFNGRMTANDWRA
jgi:hypothetical protein